MALVALAATAAAVPAGGGARSAEDDEVWAVERLTLRRQVGQLIVTGFAGTRASAYLRGQLRRGEAGGVILFGANVRSRGQLRGLSRALQRAAGRSALVSTDQEGGSVRRLRFAEPLPGQPAQGTARRVGALARRGARQLRGVGVNVNLAPVADVAQGRSAMKTRTFRGTPRAIAAKVRASVRGWRRGRVAATVKHFPGFGAATRNTDFAPATIRSRRWRLHRIDLAPFRAAVSATTPLVMASHALYPALDHSRIASQSPVILRGLLRRRMGFRGVVITDSLEARAVRERMPVTLAAERSVSAGADVALVTGPGASGPVFRRLLRRARRSPAFRARVRAAAARVLALKRSLGLRPPR